MYEEKTLQIGRIVFILDVAATIASFVIAVFSRKAFLSDSELDFFAHIALLPLVLLFIISSLSYFDGYKSPGSASLLEYGWTALRATAFSIGAILTILFILKIEYISRLVIVTFSVIEVSLVFSIRAAIKQYYGTCVRNGSSCSRVLIIGTGERARELSLNLKQQTEWGIEIIGHLDKDGLRSGNDIAGVPVIGTVSDIGKILKSNVIDEVIIAIPRSLLSDAEPIAHACEEEGIKLKIMADIYNLEVVQTKLLQLGKIPLLSLEPIAQDEIKLMAKRVIDLIITVLSLPVALPLMAVIVIAIKLDSPGPGIFVQQRVGFKKRLFPLFKFRSMYVDAEERLKEIEHLNEARGPIFKIKNDPRLTRVGKIIRKLSLDELPQLFNVLRGEMSLVGPRPMSTRDVNLFDKGIQRKRFSVKPGISCIWQISGRSDLPFERWLELDLEYIRNWTLWLDFKILIKTIPAVLLTKGAL